MPSSQWRCLSCNQVACRLCKTPSLFSEVVWGPGIGFRKSCVEGSNVLESPFLLVIAVLSLVSFRFHQV